jgi:hypothetical protein
VLCCALSWYSSGDGGSLRTPSPRFARAPIAAAPKTAATTKPTMMSLVRTPLRHQMAQVVAGRMVLA